MNERDERVKRKNKEKSTFMNYLVMLKYLLCIVLYVKKQHLK